VPSAECRVPSANLRWFFDGLADVRRRWNEGKLVTTGTPERE
jgi:hypothetical protein